MGKMHPVKEGGTDTNKQSSLLVKSCRLTLLPAVTPPENSETKTTWICYLKGTRTSYLS